MYEQRRYGYEEPWDYQDTFGYDEFDEYQDQYVETIDEYDYASRAPRYNWRTRSRVT